MHHRLRLYQNKSMRYHCKCEKVNRCFKRLLFISLNISHQISIKRSLHHILYSTSANNIILFYYLSVNRIYILNVLINNIDKNIKMKSEKIKRKSF